jgi:hypothetical protein
VHMQKVVNIDSTNFLWPGHTIITEGYQLAIYLSTDEENYKQEIVLW